MDGSPEGDLLGLIILLGVSAFFAASEAAFLAVSRTRVRQMKEQRQWGAGVLSLLHSHRALILTVLLLGITLSNYTAERIATLLSIRFINADLGPLVAVVVMTIVIIVFCEVLPIQVGAHHPENTSRWASLIIAPVSALLMPLVFVLSLVSRSVVYLLGVRTGSLLPGVSEEHLKAMIEQSEEQGMLEAGERRMMHGALDFGDRTAAQIMTPRPDMIVVEAKQTLAEALALGLEHHHSRLPVYEETPDDVIGILHLKDLLPYLVNSEMDREVRVAARNAMHVPASLPTDELLAQLRRRRQMLAIVKDEFGGTAGLVTVEDVLEVIVGDIRDEYDVEEPEVLEVDAHQWLCDARMAVQELEDYIHHRLPATELDSLGGLVLELAGRIPDPGDVYRWDNLELKVEAVTGPRLERIRVTLLDTPPGPVEREDVQPDA